MTVPPASPSPVIRLGCPDVPTPLVVAVPHAGRYYPDELEEARAVARSVLEELEDRYADRLIQKAVEAGASAIIGTYARAWIDLNRGEGDVGDPDDMAASPRVRAGLGLIPSRLAGRPLWRGSPARVDIDERIRSAHAPYHQAVAEALRMARDRHGVALLVDCHSMPPLSRSGRPAAQIVIGDRHGASAGPGIAEAAATAARRHGLQAARNVPYAGAFTLDHHARPAENIHGIQVEMDRSLYLRPGLREPSDRIGPAAALFAEICWSALGALTDSAQAAAAE
jgi:N-formylglutamate amidohydrolase